VVPNSAEPLDGGYYAQVVEFTLIKRPRDAYQ